MAKAKYSRRKDGLYVANRTIDGKRKVFYGHTCKEVDEKISQYLTTREKGRKVSTIIDDWWEYLERTVSPNTVVTYHAGKNRALTEFGGCYAVDVTQQDIQAYIWEFALKGYAKGTVELEVSILRSLFKYAKKAGDIPATPVQDIELPKDLIAGTRPALTEQQQKAVDEYRGDDLALVGQILLYTGIRKGELAALTWQDIDTKNDVIHINKKISYATSAGVLEDHLKSKNGLRDIPIPKKLRQQLPKRRIGLVIPGDDGRHLKKGQIMALWVQYCREAGLADDQGNPEITMHQLRHTYATICLEAGVEIKTCAMWMGDTESIVSRIYQEIRKKKEIHDTEKLDSYLDAFEA